MKTCSTCLHEPLGSSEWPCSECIDDNTSAYWRPKDYLEASDVESPASPPSTQHPGDCTHSGELLAEVRRLRHDLNQLREAMVRELAQNNRRA